MNTDQSKVVEVDLLLPAEEISRSVFDYIAEQKYQKAATAHVALQNLLGLVSAGIRKLSTATAVTSHQFDIGDEYEEDEDDAQRGGGDSYSFPLFQVQALDRFDEFYNRTETTEENTLPRVSGLVDNIQAAINLLLAPGNNNTFRRWLALYYRGTPGRNQLRDRLTKAINPSNQPA